MDTSTSPNIFDETLSFTREPNKLALAYWQSCRGSRTMPSRADLDPVAMKKFTPNVGLVEIRKLENGVAYFVRRAGMRWEEVYGPMTGKFLSEFLPPHVVSSWYEIFGRAREIKAPVRLCSRVDFGDKRWLAVEQLVAPLGEQDDVAMLFVSFVAWPNSAPLAATLTVSSDNTSPAPNSAAH